MVVGDGHCLIYATQVALDKEGIGQFTYAIFAQEYTKNLRFSVTSTQRIVSLMMMTLWLVPCVFQ